MAHYEKSGIPLELTLFLSLLPGPEYALILIVPLAGDGIA